MRPPQRQRSGDDLELLLTRRRLRRAQPRRHRRLLVATLVLVVAAVAATLGGAASFFALAPGCDLGALHPVSIGQNSFVYAADGSLLGAIPAERNRQPIPLRRMSR